MIDKTTNIDINLNYLNAAGSIPIKPINAIPIKPVRKKAIPNPLRPGGTLEYSSFSLMPAMATIANAHPIPPPKPKDNDCAKLYSFVIINSDPPNMAQFTVISLSLIHI